MFSQHLRIATSRHGNELLSFPCKFLFMMAHKFSIGFISGLLPGQSSIKGTSQSLSQCVRDLAVWANGPSCWNILALHMSKDSGKWSAKSSKYTFAFTLRFLGNSTTLPSPRPEKQPQTTSESGCFTVFSRLRGSLPRQQYTLAFWIQVTLKVASSDHNTDSQLSSPHCPYLPANLIR